MLSETATQTIQTTNPATGEPLEQFPLQTDAEVERSLGQAEKAFSNWRSIPLEQRAAKLAALAKHLRANKDKLARSMTVEMGKIIVEAEAEVEKCARAADWYAEHGPAMFADQRAPVEEAQSYVSYLPLGPILAIMPWNFPLWQVIRFGVPTLLAGNVVLLKHAPNVQRSALELERVFDEAGFPRRCFQNLIVATDKVPAIIADQRVAGVTLTGSPRAGAAVAAAAGQALKKSVLELGGSDAFLVLEDADIDQAVPAGIRARFTNAGQVCLAAKRFFLVDAIADEFEEKFVAATRQLRMMDPLSREAQIGPIARNDLRDGLANQVEKTIQAGARCLTGGRKASGEGFFYEPTVLAGVHPGMEAFEEETFGPVAALIRVPDAEAALRLTNQSKYGLSSVIWTRDLDRARSMARQIEAGGVFINTATASDPRIPIGGIKRSGYGRELSHYGPHEFVNIQAVWIAK